ncbi:MAG TPA: M20/M25/M40 family metallo-hydrolase [Thermoanaerobaculia bacterium]|jgi:acetylornithine deacetylase/succinyl-diaminopimelate desuccinylase-like protein
MSPPRLAGLILAAVVLVALSARAEAPPPEPVRWLREYLQIDTTNPPGNEHLGAELLAAILAREGIPARLLESPEGRTSLYARLASPASGGRALALVHHIDVVPAGEEWRVAPFSGRPYRDSLWGRGAVDDKSLGIAHLAALVACRREGTALTRDVIYLAVADEERGGGQGTGWLLERHPELFAGLEAVLGEGGSNRTIGDRVVWWGIEVTQKRPLWLRIAASGRGGHGSGFHPASPTHQLVRGLARLLERPPRLRVTDAARHFFTALGAAEGGNTVRFAERLDEVIREEGPARPLPPGLPVYFLDTVQVTQLDNGAQGPNVVAAQASAYVDVRLLPDTDAEAFLGEVREVLGRELEVEVLLAAPPAPASPTDHPIYRAVERVLAVRAPVVPLFIAGTTDSRYFRERGIPAYGVQPFALNPEELRGIHADDEHLPVAAFLRGVETLRRILVSYAGE